MARVTRAKAKARARASPELSQLPDFRALLTLAVQYEEKEKVLCKSFKFLGIYLYRTVQYSTQCTVRYSTVGCVYSRVQ